MVFCVLYSSVAATDLNASELEALLGTSRRNNARVDVTGLLLHVRSEQPGEAYFVQLLEGDQAAVELTYQRIAKDELHEDLVVLTSGQKEQRMFSSWSMQLDDLTDAQLRQRLREMGAPEAVGLEQAVRDRDAMQHLVDGYA